MNISALLRQSWHITFRNWSLWLLMLAVYIVFIPAGALSAGFGVGLAMLTLPPLPGPQPEWITQIRQWPRGAWVIFMVVLLLVTVITTAIVWLLQAAVMRGAAMAAERGAVDLGEALRLGRQRVISLLTLGLTFGVIITGVGLLPAMLHLVLAQFAASFSPMILQSMQTVTTPMIGVASIALLLVMMSIALEDLRPRAAFRQAWRVFRSGWWGFVVVIGLTTLASFALALLSVPVILAPVIALVFNRTAGLLIALCACGVGGPLGLALMLFIAVYTQVLYTLVYRAAAPMAGSGGPATGGAS